MYFIQKPKDKGKWEKEKDSQFHLKYLNCRIVLNRPKKKKKKKTKKKNNKKNSKKIPHPGSLIIFNILH